MFSSWGLQERWKGKVQEATEVTVETVKSSANSMPLN
jgi:hypothetical protein